MNKTIAITLLALLISTPAQGDILSCMREKPSTLTGVMEFRRGVQGTDILRIWLRTSGGNADFKAEVIGSVRERGMIFLGHKKGDKTRSDLYLPEARRPRIFSPMSVPSGLIIGALMVDPLTVMDLYVREHRISIVDDVLTFFAGTPYTGYSKAIMRVNKLSCTPMYVTLYNREGSISQVISLGEAERGSIPPWIHVTDQETGKKIYITITEMEVNGKINKSEFSGVSLTKGR